MKKILAVFFCALCLTGCGKRGRLDFPPNATYPRRYLARRQPVVAPKPAAVAPASETIAPESLQDLNRMMELEQ